ncbi:MAG: DUF3325 domain-containing protein [Burkholderiales bacterium]|nr:DUF3325 domain-containing protein [Burkholderiales bacterium]
MLVLAALASFAGFAWLALAMEPHWRQVQGRHGPGRKARLVLRVLGGVALLLSAVLCFIADRPSMAVLVWIMLLAASAPMIGLTLAWRPVLLRIFWPRKA